MIDSNGRYWLQPLFIANDNVYDSYNVFGKYYNALLNTDNALKCFKDPYL